MERVVNNGLESAAYYLKDITKDALPTFKEMMLPLTEGYQQYLTIEEYVDRMSGVPNFDDPERSPLFEAVIQLATLQQEQDRAIDEEEKLQKELITYKDLLAINKAPPDYDRRKVEAAITHLKQAIDDFEEPINAAIAKVRPFFGVNADDEDEDDTINEFGLALKAGLAKPVNNYKDSYYNKMEYKAEDKAENTGMTENNLESMVDKTLLIDPADLTAMTDSYQQYARTLPPSQVAVLARQQRKIETETFNKLPLQITQYPYNAPSLAPTSSLVDQTLQQATGNQIAPILAIAQEVVQPNFSQNIVAASNLRQDLNNYQLAKVDRRIQQIDTEMTNLSNQIVTVQTETQRSQTGMVIDSDESSNRIPVSQFGPQVDAINNRQQLAITSLIDNTQQKAEEVKQQFSNAAASSAAISEKQQQQYEKELGEKQHKIDMLELKLSAKQEKQQTMEIDQQNKENETIQDLKAKIRTKQNENELLNIKLQEKASRDEKMTVDQQNKENDTIAELKSKIHSKQAEIDILNTKLTQKSEKEEKMRVDQQNKEVEAIEKLKEDLASERQKYSLLEIKHAKGIEKQEQMEIDQQNKLSQQMEKIAADFENQKVLIQGKHDSEIQKLNYEASIASNKHYRDADSQSKLDQQRALRKAAESRKDRDQELKLELNRQKAARTLHTEDREARAEEAKTKRDFDSTQAQEERKFRVEQTEQANDFKIQQDELQRGFDIDMQQKLNDFKLKEQEKLLEAKNLNSHKDRFFKSVNAQLDRQQEQLKLQFEHAKFQSQQKEDAAKFMAGQFFDASKKTLDILGHRETQLEVLEAEFKAKKQERSELVNEKREAKNVKTSQKAIEEVHRMQQQQKFITRDNDYIPLVEDFMKIYALDPNEEGLERTRALAVKDKVGALFDRALEGVDYDQVNPSKTIGNRDLYDITQYATNPIFLKSAEARKAALAQFTKYEKLEDERKANSEKQAADLHVYSEMFGAMFAHLRSADPNMDKSWQEPGSEDMQQEVIDRIKNECRDTLVRALDDFKSMRYVDVHTMNRLKIISEMTDAFKDANYMSTERSKTQLNSIGLMMQSAVVAAQKHNENLESQYDSLIMKGRATIYNADEARTKEEKREEQRESIKAKLEYSVAKQLEKMGLMDSSNPFSGSGRSGRMRYIQQRGEEILGFQHGDRMRYQEEAQAAKERYQQQVGHGQSVTGTFGSAASVGKSLTKIAGQDIKITEEDMELLKKLTVDKKTGVAMKIESNGEVIPLTDDERERAAYIVIELCLFIYTKHVKTISEKELERYREAIKDNITVDNEEMLLPLLKVANTVANKLLQGQIDSSTIKKYVKALAGRNRQDKEDEQMDEE